MFSRAIVCRECDYGTAQWDPHNWGIVTDVHPDRHFTVDVVWADGRRTHHTGFDLKVIYPGASMEDVKQYSECLVAWHKPATKH